MRLESSLLRRVTIAAACAATLTACQSSPATSRRGPAADPVVTTERRIEVRCPVELGQPLPARIGKPAGGEVTGNDAGMTWLRDHLGRENVLEARLVDAAKACPKAEGAGGGGGQVQH